MTTKEVLDALHRYYEDGEYLKLEEVGEDAHRQGRKIDLLVITTWQSRGYQRIAIEIKVSMSDFRKEIKSPAKADFWWRHSNRFMIAAPKELEAKIKLELPPNWGLLSVDEKGKVKIAVRPEPNRSPEPFTWQQQIGLMRVASDCTAGVRSRSHSEGYEAARKYYEKQLEKATRSPEDTRRLTAYDELRACVEAFEKETGISLTDRYGYASANSGQQTGQILNVIRQWHSNPIVQRERLEHVVNMLKRQMEDLVKLGELIEPIVQPGVSSNGA
jgi:hypothetical protein